MERKRGGSTLQHHFPTPVFAWGIILQCCFWRLSLQETLNAHLKNVDQVGTVDSVVLIGGCTRIPCLRNGVDDLMKGLVCKALNPDEAVARGAALLAAGAVRLAREVLGLTTNFTMAGSALTVKFNERVDNANTIERRLSTRMVCRSSASFSVSKTLSESPCEFCFFYLY